MDEKNIVLEATTCAW